MEKGSRGLSCRAAICGIVALLSATAFSCSLAAEFRKVKEKDMKLDGSLCSLPKSSAFELGVAAIAFLFVAQLVGTSAAVTTVCGPKPKKSAATRGRVPFVALLVLSWLSFAVAVVLLATAASMNHGQRYGRGWMDGDCYVARSGVFGGAAALVVVTALITLGLTFATESTAMAMATTRGGTRGGPVGATAPPMVKKKTKTGPPYLGSLVPPLATTPASCTEAPATCTGAHHNAASPDAEQPGGRSKQ